MHRMYRTQVINTNLEDAWHFFSSPGNLSKITPPELSFQIVSGGNDRSIKNGQQIEYVVRPVFNLPIKWVSEICDVIPLSQFVDRQITGPYSFWEHTHKFRSTVNGIVISDEIIYALPHRFIGWLAHSLFVKRRLKVIFDYRSKKLTQIFG
jgi:ligand-binding SRPBCC domain-containing protein